MMIAIRLLAVGLLSISMLCQTTVAFHNHGVGQRKCNPIQRSSQMRQSFRVPRIVGVEQKALPLGGDAAVSAAVTFKSSDFVVFLLGVFPFAWATVEFWRRIMFGEAFGTGSDQVIIGMDDSPEDSRGRRVLGRGALGTAYFLFAASFATLAVVLYAVTSSAPPPEVLPLPSSSDVISEI